MSILKETLSYYRDRRREAKEKKQLINAKTNFHLLEQLIRKCNDNPNLKINVTTADGTRLELFTYKKRDVLYGQIDGDEYIE